MFSPALTAVPQFALHICFGLLSFKPAFNMGSSCFNPLSTYVTSMLCHVLTYMLQEIDEQTCLKQGFTVFVAATTVVCFLLHTQFWLEFLSSLNQHAYFIQKQTT